jgi:hypothetical protein
MVLWLIQFVQEAVHFVMCCDSNTNLDKQMKDEIYFFFHWLYSSLGPWPLLSVS